MWLRIYGIPIVVWHSHFFVSLVEVWGSFICVDKNTASGKVFDVVRVTMRVPLDVSIPNNFKVSIHRVPFKLTVREDSLGFTRLGPGISKLLSSDNDSLDSEDLSCENSFDTEYDSKKLCSKDSIHQFPSGNDA